MDLLYAYTYRDLACRMTACEVPQVSQCPVKYRVIASMGLHGLMLLFFASEPLGLTSVTSQSGRGLCFA